MRQLLQNVTILLQNANTITKCDFFTKYVSTNTYQNEIASYDAAISSV